MYNIRRNLPRCAGGRSSSALAGLVRGSLSILCHGIAGHGVLWEWGREREPLRLEPGTLQCVLLP